MKTASLLLAPLLLGGCASVPPTADIAPPAAAGPSPYLLLLAADKDGAEEDFFAVVDVRPESPDLGKVVSTQPYGHRKSMPHHLEYVLPAGGRHVFANAHHPERTLLLDVSAAPALRITKSIAPPAPLRFPHDYARLPNGNVLMGFLRSDGPSPKASDTESPGGHGGLAEYTAAGELLRSASAAVPGRAEPIRLYAILPMPDIDRIVTTSARMMEKSSANVVQVWRYSDLRLLHTIDVPDGRKPDGTPLDWAAEMPFGPRRMADGSVLLNTYMCGFYRLTGLASDAPSIAHVYDIQGRDPKDPSTRVGCSVPVVVGTHWLMPVAWSQMVVVLDIADPAAPREVSRLQLPADFNAHWAAKDPASDRIVVGSEVEKERGMYLLRYDPSGMLSIDTRVGAGSDRPGYIDLAAQSWPHGPSGAAWAHAGLFLPAAAP
ncbi:LVIVD repeat-containing protein [Cognatilysobacter tabacisoli]|uniref:hypothetical protein n=1 Tax=Cognatilysobacter tabacisoli TaxID=2315424 RepID=UPI001300B96D|nr:hypothetical protein [Lysobacter tabacisoli]